MNFGILHLARPERAIAEAHRVLRSGGRFAFTVWAPPEEALGFAVVLQAVKEVGNASVPLPPGPPFFRFSDSKEAIAILEETGFSQVRAQKVPLRWRLSSGDQFFDAFHKGTARTGGLLRAQSSDELKAVRNLVVERVTERFAAGDQIDIAMPAWVYSGMKVG